MRLLALVIISATIPYTAFANYVYSHPPDSIHQGDTITILIDEVLVQKVVLGENAKYDSCNFSNRVLVSYSSGCNIQLDIWYNSNYYVLTVPRDVLFYGNSIQLRIWTPKVPKKRPTVCSYAAQSGQLTLAGYGIVMKIKPIK